MFPRRLRRRNRLQAACQHLKSRINQVDAYMLKANMTNVACVLLGTGASRVLAISVAMWKTGGIQRAKMASSTTKVQW
jgi:hypothetical protein